MAGHGLDGKDASLLLGMAFCSVGMASHNVFSVMFGLGVVLRIQCEHVKKLILLYDLM